MLHRSSPAAARLTSLYEAHAPDAFRYALHLTGRREDAEDVVQYVFLQAYAALEAGRELVNPRAWLIKATKHRSLNLIRDRRDTPAAELDPPAPFRPDDGEAEALTEVRAALWSLPETQHHAFVLRHWSGLSQDEIADVLATTPSAVESLLVRARATLVAEREEGDTECAGVRGRLARMLAPTPAQSAHLAVCRRCRTAQSRLLRASEFATAFALVPSPHVLHALSAAIPGFGASGAVAGASATGAAAGGGTGGAAVSTVSAATKVGILTKVVIAATTAAVAVTAVHPLRTAVAHTLFRHAPAMSTSAAPRPSAAHTDSARTRGQVRVDAGAPVTPVVVPPVPPSTHGSGSPTAARSGAKPAKPGKAGAGKGKSGTAGSNGNGKGQAAGGASGGATHAKTHGKSATAPGRTKAAGAGATGKGEDKGAAKGKGAKANAGGASKTPTKTKTKTKTATKPGGGAAKTGGGAPKTGGGAANGNAGGNGKGNGKQ